ncbi:calcium-binding and coiled-coil domain-containing protein 2 [Kryptolebias marmoratus]|uniref:Calcium binding and coiled-coil domain 2 n=1 Tax=Kryptolebias marmoratus TaxID=37003 RepID=A0A3Q3A4J1_KRYMA|nr:calcium-binding and coiled-coil domain-containing protein 2 [Kryptolebias marmoratus]
METSKEAAGADLSPATFSQVVFTDIQYSYLPSAPITCRFTLNAAFQPSSRDWVGIFKVGWSSTKDYHTFVWVETSQDAEGLQTMTRQAVFKEYYLPKDEIEFYQFCYIDSSGQVRGASTPFRFTNPTEQNVESSMEDDLLVITTQEQVEQSQREKDGLQKELNLMRAENENLKSSLLKEQNENRVFKEQSEERKTEWTKLGKEMDQIKEHNEKLKHTLQLQLKENDRLKEEMMIQLQNSAEQEKLSQSLVSKTMEEKYDRAVVKISQLKEEREELKQKLEAQSDENTKLKAKLRETERELSRTNDRFQLLQVDFQSSNKEKERVAAELQRLQSLTCSIDEVKRENRELSRRLSEQETMQRTPQDDLKVQCQTLSRKLHETQAKLVAEKEETRTAKRQAEVLENELKDIREQLKNVATASDVETRRSSKYELVVTELNKLLADKDIFVQEQEQQMKLVKRENLELVKENQKLKGDIERLRSVYSSPEGAAAAVSAPEEESPYLQPDVVAPASDASANQQSSQEQQENIYDTIDSLQQPEEPALVCRHCQERFPGITQNELEQHEQSHRVCPFCTMICDSMEQAVFEDHVYGHEL